MNFRVQPGRGLSGARSKASTVEAKAAASYPGLGLRDAISGVTQCIRVVPCSAILIRPPAGRPPTFRASTPTLITSTSYRTSPGQTSGLIVTVNRFWAQLNSDEVIIFVIGNFRLNLVMHNVAEVAIRHEWHPNKIGPIR